MKIRSAIVLLTICIVVLDQPETVIAVHSSAASKNRLSEDEKLMLQIKAVEEEIADVHHKWGFLGRWFKKAKSWAHRKWNKVKHHASRIINKVKNNDFNI